MNPDPAAKASSRHDLDHASLSRYLAEANDIPGLKIPVVSTKIGYGQSNPTYFLTDAAYVCRSCLWCTALTDTRTVVHGSS